jgi:triacylglycerol esterase/lipase EstA (alpha/beta hydrolase family)
MGPEKPNRLRLPAVLILNLLVFGIMFACCNPGTSSVKSKVAISICAIDSLRAQDFLNAACGTGAVAAQTKAAKLQIRALDQNNKPLAHSQVNITVHGANSTTSSVTTDGNGLAQYSYLAAHLGTDTVTVSPGSAADTNTSKTIRALIHWIPGGTTVHPIIWVHGIHEDATDFAHELHGVTDADQAGDASEQTWSSLLDALTTTYDPSAIQAFCYIDDIAWTHPTSGCHPSESPGGGCTSGNTATCVSQSSVDDNAVALAQLVMKMQQQFSKPVTLIAYSMGGAIVRTMLAGCLNSSFTPSPTCTTAAGQVDHVFLLNAAQEGSWLLNVKRGLDPAALSGSGIPAISISPFAAVLPLIDSAIFAQVKDRLGLDANLPAETDLTPQSPNINQHNHVQPLPGPDFYSFYGDIRLGVQTNFLIYSTPPQTLLPLGDLVMLAQADSATATPVWGGATLCDGCSPLGLGQTFHESGRYHEWALTDSITIQMNALVPLLSASDAVSGVQAALSSPVQHLNVSQPGTQDPGSPIQVKDITGLAGSPTTDMSNEIYLILVHADGLE